MQNGNMGPKIKIALPSATLPNLPFGQDEQHVCNFVPIFKTHFLLNISSDSEG